jgi:hypothetical protein
MMSIRSRLAWVGVGGDSDSSDSGKGGDGVDRGSPSPSSAADRQYIDPFQTRDRDER